MVWILAWHRVVQHFCYIFCCTSAGWRAIWVHPPACAGSSFDMASVDKSTPSLSVEAEVDRVAEAQWILSDPVGGSERCWDYDKLNAINHEFHEFWIYQVWIIFMAMIQWMLGLWYWEDLVNRNDLVVSSPVDGGGGDSTSMGKRTTRTTRTWWEALRKLGRRWQMLVPAYLDLYPRSRQGIEVRKVKICQDMSRDVKICQDMSRCNLQIATDIYRYLHRYYRCKMMQDLQ